MLKSIETVALLNNSQISIINETLNAMSNAQNYVVDTCYELEETNKFKIHHTTYPILRKQFNLPAQLSVIANKYACVAVKSVLKNKGNKPKFNSKYIHYDSRSCSLNLEKGIVSLLTLKGRIKVKIEIPKYFKKYLKWKAKESNLIKCKDGKYRLMISVEKIIPKSDLSGNKIGVDRGINNLIATSDGWIYDSNTIWKIKNKYVKLRSALQSKGTRSAKRHLIKIRGKEKRFMRDVNHSVTKTLVESIGKNGIIVLEKLKGIRNAKYRHEQNWKFSNWSFFQFESFLKYKAEEKSIEVAYINPKNTSRECSKCNNIDKTQRKGSTFKCKSCNTILNADFNASINILNRYINFSGSCQSA
jgi:IS605 OrfB family transposase